MQQPPSTTHNWSTHQCGNDRELAKSVTRCHLPKFESSETFQDNQRWNIQNRSKCICYNFTRNTKPWIIHHGVLYALEREHATQKGEKFRCGCKALPDSGGQMGQVDRTFWSSMRGTRMRSAADTALMMTRQVCSLVSVPLMYVCMHVCPSVWGRSMYVCNVLYYNVMWCCRV